MKIILEITVRPKGTYTQWVTINNVDDLNKVIGASIRANKASLIREDKERLQFMKNASVLTEAYNHRQQIVDWVAGGPNPLT